MIHMIYDITRYLLIWVHQFCGSQVLIDVIRFLKEINEYRFNWYTELLISHEFLSAPRDEIRTNKIISSGLMYLKFWTFIWTKFTKKWLQLNNINWNLNKYWKKSHFLSEKLIFYCLKKNPSKKINFFLLSFIWTFRTSGTFRIIISICDAIRERDLRFKKSIFWLCVML